MDNRQLRHFLAVYEEGSLTAAAQRAHVAQPTLSASLSQLEGTLRTRLFRRHKKGVTPTAEGERLYPLAKRLVGELQALSQLFRETPERPTVTVGLMPALDAARVRGFLKRLRTVQPGIRLRLVDHEADTDLRLVSDALARPGEAFQPLWRETFVLALPADDPLVLQETVEPADLNGHPLIHRCQCELGQEVEGMLRRHSITPDIVAQVQNEEWALELVASGVGAAIIPEGCIGPRSDVVTRPLAGAPGSRRVGIAHDPEAVHAETVAALAG